MGVVDRDVGGELALAALFLIWTLLDTVRRSRLEIGRPVDISPVVPSAVPLPAKQNNRSVFSLTAQAEIHCRWRQHKEILGPEVFFVGSQRTL